MEENDQQPQKSNKPTREQIRANNRETRLQNGWANICPVETCKRKFTSKTGFLAHLENYHKIKVNERAPQQTPTLPAPGDSAEPMPETLPEPRPEPPAGEAPCCPEGERFERETGSHPDDHPGDCTTSDPEKTAAK